MLVEPWAKAYAARKRAAGKTFAMVSRALANQWVRIIHALWLTHHPYQPSVFEQAQQRHQHAVA